MESLKCPNCGAPINIKLDKCEYCESVFHIGWNKDRLNQLGQEKIDDYTKQITILQKQLKQTKFTYIISKPCPLGNSWNNG